MQEEKLAALEFNIRGFNPMTMIDWPDKIACVIYLGGCNLRCPYCHASSLVLNPGKLEKIPYLKIKEYLLEKKDWLDGAVVCGGEPTLEPRFLDLLSEIKKIPLAVKLDTNGTNAKVLDLALRNKLIDYVAMDIKAPLDLSHNFYVQADIDPVFATTTIRQSIEIIKNSDIDYEFRTTVVPTILQRQDILSIAQAISGARHYVLQQFVPRDTISPQFLKLTPYEDIVLKEMATLASEHVKKVSTRL